MNSISLQSNDIERITDLRIRLACILAFEEALRPSEIVRIKTTDFVGGQLSCGHKKKKQERTIIMGPLLKDFVQKHLKKMQAKKAYLFRRLNNRGKMSIVVLNETVMKALSKIGGVCLDFSSRDI